MNMENIVRIEADYYDGKTARRRPATLVVADGAVTLGELDDLDLTPIPVSQLRVSARLAGAPRRVEFPDGGVATTWNDAAVEQALGVPAIQTLAHRLESHVGFVLLSLVGLAICAWLAYDRGIPWLADQTATRLPVSLEVSMGEYALTSGDNLLFSPSTATAEDAAAIEKLFEELKAKADLPEEVRSHMRLELRDAERIGPNAFSLPGGIIVVTDQLLTAVPDADQRAAVLAHEFGHVARRHVLRRLLQSSMLGALTLAVFGDANSLAGIAATFPSAIAGSSYSRDAEREADQFAFALMKQTGRSPLALGKALEGMEDFIRERNEEKAGERAAKGGKAAEAEKYKRWVLPDYLSSHPNSDARLKAAEEAAAQP